MDAVVLRTLNADSTLRPIIDAHGEVTLEPADDPFRRLIISVLRQQVSMEAAAAIRQRLFERFEITPDALRLVDHSELTEVGLSRQKARYVSNIASSFHREGYDLAYFQKLDDGAVMDELTAIGGIGPWTAKMFLLFCLAREDVFPVEDLGIRQAMWSLYGEELAIEEMDSIARRWAPYRSYATMYLWRHIEA